MKKIFLILVIIPLIVSAQKKNEAELALIVFNKGLSFYEKEQFDSCLAVWKGMVETQTGKGTGIYENAFFNIPVVYAQTERYDLARQWYQKVLDSDLNDGDETGNLMEPHTNYKYKSAMALASLAFRDSAFQEALQWLDKADTVYRYWGFEGSATNISQREAGRLKFRTELLLKLNKREEAVRAIVIELLCARSLSSFFQESSEELFNMIEKNAYREKWAEGMKGASLVTVDSQHWNFSFSIGEMIYQIPVTTSYPGRELPHYWRILFFREPPDKAAVINYLEKTEFFQQLQK